MTLTDQLLYRNNRTWLEPLIKPHEIILMHGGGNFGDLWRVHTNLRNDILTWFPNNKIIFLPQTVNYRNDSFIKHDLSFFKAKKDLVITVRSKPSFEFVQKQFANIESHFIPDSAYMLGDITPLVSPPLYDILILKRTDHEAVFSSEQWTRAVYPLLGLTHSYQFADWYDFDEKKSLWGTGYYKAGNDLRSSKSLEAVASIADQRTKLINRIVAQARVVVTDRMHGTIWSMLMGKPFVIVSEIYRKTLDTLESSYSDKEECEWNNLRAEYDKDPKDAIKKALVLLEEEKMAFGQQGNDERH